MRNALLGVIVGLLAGWLLFRNPSEPRRAERFEPPPAPAVPAAEVRDENPPARVRPTGAETRIDREWVRQADARTLRHGAHRARNEHVEIGPEAVAQAIERIDGARSSRDWNLFVALVQFLGAAGTPEAQTKLVALVGDTTLLFHDWRVAGDFRAALVEAHVEGIVAATRARIEMEKEQYRDAHRWSGWYEVVARHGSTADLEWLVAFEGRGTDSGDDLARALGAASANPPAAESYIALCRAGRGDEGASREFARNNPAAALPFFREEFERGTQDLSTAAGAYGSAVTEETLGEAKAFLLGLKDPEKRVAAVSAVSAMQDRKLDISGLEPILLAPVEDAERLAGATPEERRRGFYRVLYGIEYNRLVWSERAARALDSFAAVYEDRGGAEGLRDVASEIRAQIRSDSAGWLKKD